MAVQTPTRPIAALRGPTAVVRGRGRPPLEADATDNLIEVAALKREASVHAQRCLPVAKRLLNSALYFGIPDAVRDASYLVGALEAMARRHEG